jgi:RNA-splicing ligase RtcB
MDFKAFGNIEEKTIDSATYLNDYYKIKKSRLMPDAHFSGKVPVGFVGQFDYPIPELTTPDIGCGVTTLIMDFKKPVEFNDKIFNEVREMLEYRETHNTVGEDTFNDYLYIQNFKDKDFYNRTGISKDNTIFQFGQIGSGNHFAEIGAKDNRVYVAIHSGSRNLGAKVWKYWKNFIDKKQHLKRFKKDFSIIARNSNEGEDIKKAFDLYKEYLNDVEFLFSDEDIEQYYNDLIFTTTYASQSRFNTAYAIKDILKKYFGLFTGFEKINTKHNYYSRTDDKWILRKGAIRAFKEHKVVIPKNMKEGIWIAKGKGNEDWMQSAPHGLGRILSRTQARDELNEKDLIDDLKGININKNINDIIDESPRSYKNSNEVRETIEDTVEIIEEIKPVFSFKI